MLLCRKRKVLSIKIDNIEFRLDDQPEVSKPVAPRATTTYTGITEDTKIDMPDALTEDQLLYYSAQQEVGHGQ